MVFVRRVAGRSGSTKVQIAERRGGRDVVLEHVGTAHDEAELALLLAEAERRLRPGQEALGFLAETDVGSVSRPGVITSKSSAVLWNVLENAYAHLGFDVVADEAFKQLVLARLVEPTSKADSVRVLGDLGVAHVSLRTMFRSLQRAEERDYRGTIATACFTHALSSGDVSLCLYDVTTLYFEAENEDELRKVGFSKERRVDPQVVVGLLVDRGGFPLEIGCYEGNKAETSTIIPMVRQFTQRHQLADIVVVADAGMLSASNLKDLDEAGLRFIVGSRSTKAPGDLASHFRWHGDAFTDGQIIDTITARIDTAAARAANDASKKIEPVWDPAVHTKSWRAVWSYSRKRATRDGHTLTLQENRARAVIAGERAPRTPRFVTTKNGSQTLDEASLTRARRLAGLKGYVTNIPARQMPASEVLTSYHDLWHVEASFRMSKTDLRARPIFHHTRDAIEAHLTIVFAALAVTRHVTEKSDYSIKRIVRALRPVRDAVISLRGQRITATTPLEGEAADIAEKLLPNAAH